MASETVAVSGEAEDDAGDVMLRISFCAPPTLETGPLPFVAAAMGEDRGMCCCDCCRPPGGEAAGEDITEEVTDMGAGMEACIGVEAGVETA